MTDFTVTMNEFLPLREVVFQTLRQAILKGELKPGERLMEVALAERLGVSRTPIREAMRKLELEGLVVMVPRKGAQVASITEKDLTDVLEVRITLENFAIEKACTHMTEEDMDKLWLASKASDNARLLQVLTNMREQIYRYRLEYLKDELSRDKLLEEHRRLTDAIRRRDAAQAQRISFEHLENQRKAIIRSIRERKQQ